MAAGFFRKAWNKIKDVTSSIGNGVKKAATKTWGGIKSVGNKALNFVGLGKQDSPLQQQQLQEDVEEVEQQGPTLKDLLADQAKYIKFADNVLAAAANDTNAFT